MTDRTIETSNEDTELAKLKAREDAAAERLLAIDAKRLLKERELAVEAREREATEAETLDRLEEEHGDRGKMIDFVRTDRGVVVVKRAPGVVYHRFENSKMKAADREQLVLSCLVFPDVQTYRAIISDQPAIVLTLADKLVELYGFKRKEDAGK